MAKVYIAMSADVIHHGHINIIKEAAKLGELTVGIIADKTIAEYKRVPLLDFEERRMIIENIKGVANVIEQKTLDYEENLLALRPDYVVHGDDWKTGTQAHFRAKVIELLKAWGGKLIEIEYTEGVSVSQLEAAIRGFGTTPDIRRGKLKKLMYMDKITRVIEVHNGLTGLLAEKTTVVVDDSTKSFDAMWISSLCDSTAKGKPDIELVDLTSRLNTINEVLEVTTKPIILDGDTGGLVEHFVYTVRTVERLGVSAIIIEDKIGLKKNSLFGTDVSQEQDSIESFCHKIQEGKKAQVTNDFMIIARIESLILKAGMGDALARAKSYIAAGADAIMIHSKDNKVDEIAEFCRDYAKFEFKVPLVCVPTSYNYVYEEELYKMGFKVVIYANHLIRSAYPAMKRTAEEILLNGRSLECDNRLLPIKDILELIPGGK